MCSSPAKARGNRVLDGEAAAGAPSNHKIHVRYFVDDGPGERTNDMIVPGATMTEFSQAIHHLRGTFCQLVSATSSLHAELKAEYYSMRVRFAVFTAE